MEIAGIDTIKGLVGTPSDKIGLSYETVNIADGLKQLWNTKHIAFLPYCMNCKRPLIWVSSPEDNVIFKCPECGRKWVKDKNWTHNMEDK